MRMLVSRTNRPLRVMQDAVELLGGQTACLGSFADDVHQLLERGGASELLVVRLDPDDYAIVGRKPLPLRPFSRKLAGRHDLLNRESFA